MFWKMHVLKYSYIRGLNSAQGWSGIIVYVNDIGGKAGYEVKIWAFNFSSDNNSINKCRYEFDSFDKRSRVSIS